MAYVSLYRKYRSQTFSDLIGQDHVVRTIQNGIKSGRIAHSYLFTGPRGTGKTSTARLVAKALCCRQGPTPEPDNCCDICEAITLGSCIDVVEMDAASDSGVEDIRERIVEAVEYQPMMCRYKVFIIDEVHDLSTKAFDALLKTVEEPPAHIIFILATTEYNKVPPTIRSRCQKYEFHRAELKDLVARLDHVLKGEAIEAEPAAVSAIARMADGGFRDALTLLEQAILTTDGPITLDQVYEQLGLVSEDAIDGLIIAIKEANVPEIMDRLASIARQGRDPRAILESMMFRLADLTRATYQVEESGSDAIREASLYETAQRVGRQTILRLRGEVAQIHKVIRDVSLPRLWLEAELVRLAVDDRRHGHGTGVVAGTRPVSPAASEARKPEAPKEKAAPKPAPPVPAPAPAPIAEEAPAPPEPTGDADFDRARTAWHEAKTFLSQKSATMKQKLGNAFLVAREGGILAVQLERQMDLEWIQDKPVRTAAILEEVRKRLDPDCEIRYVVRKKEGVAEEPKTVELPVEGQQLEKLMREIFNDGQEQA